jgi:vacuolar protein 8
VPGRSTVDYENVLADSEREAVTDLLNFLENRQETDFFTGGPLNALSTLVYSHNIDLQRSASLTFAEITERGLCILPTARLRADLVFF